jgi:glycosyltransferase involved in cell wall biosynthesis
MINYPKISVIMAVYNSDSFVGSSIQSILDQTFDDFEFLIYNDGSTDATLELLKSFRDTDKRITVVSSSQNIGLTKSLNKLVQLSNGNILARQDADDISFPERLKIQYDRLISDNLDAVYSRAVRINNKTKIPGISHYFPKKILIKYKNPYIHGTLLIKKEVLEEIGYYDEKFYYSQDYKLAYDLQKQKYKIGNINRPLYKLNTSNNISTLHSEKQKYYADCVKRQIEPVST